MKREKIINYVKLAVILYLFFNLGSIVIFIFKGLGFNTSIFNYIGFYFTIIYRSFYSKIF